LESLRFCQTEKGLEIYAWCIMPSHVHLIIGTTGKPMQDILRDFKSLLQEVLKMKSKITQGKVDETELAFQWLIWMMERAGMKNGNNNAWQLWQQHNQPIELNTNEMLDKRLDYLHLNPVISGFVYEPEHWKYSSASDYSGSKGLLDVCIIE
jgi:putative transposase